MREKEHGKKKRRKRVVRLVTGRIGDWFAEKQKISTEERNKIAGCDEKTEDKQIVST